jgi:hypothetical protein
MERFGYARQWDEDGVFSGCAADWATVIVDAHTDVLLELVVRQDEEQSLTLVLRCGSERLFERYWLPRLEA